MILITKDNLESFIQHYQGFHDSWFSNINYNIKEAKIEVLVDVFWSGEPTLKEDGTYETNKVKVKMNLNGVEQCNIKELFSWDSINDVFIKYITIKDKEFICFASEEEDPSFYVICDSIEYEELVLS